MVQVSSPPKRRLPFKPTALRNKSEPKTEAIKIDDSSDSDGGLDLFKRSKSFFPKAIAEQDALRKRKLLDVKVKPPTTPDKKGKQKETLPQSQESPTSTSPSQKKQTRGRQTPDVLDLSDDSFKATIKTPPSKRSRTSTSSANNSTSHQHEDTKVDATPSKRASGSIPYHTPRRNQPTTFKGQPVISIDDSEDDDLQFDNNDDIYNATPDRKLRDSPPPKPASRDDPDSPDPFASDTDSKDEEDEFAKYVVAARARKEETEAVVKTNKSRNLLVLVTSEIPLTTEKKFNCLLDRPLSLVRNSWCNTQHHRTFTPEERDSVFLTWRGRRLYDTTTLHSLGIRVTPTGRLTTSAHWSDREGFVEAGSAMQLEIWTEELWEAAQKRKERERLRNLGGLEESDYDSGEDGDQATAAETPEEEKIKVILKTRSNETVKSLARPQSTISDLIAYFRKARNVPDGMQVVLYFDGEQLDQETTLQDAGIEDMDTIEVHLKE